MQIQSGKIYELTVVREAPFGYFLSDGQEDVLLHQSELTAPLTIDEKVEVFIYTDDKGRLTATPTIPKVTVDKMDWAMVTDVHPDLGVFIDIGIRKDMLLGIDDLPVVRSVWPQIGDLLYIRLKPDRRGRLYAKLASEEALQDLMVNAPKEANNKNIQGYIFRTSKVGSWILTAEGYRGFIHESERREEPRVGQKVEGRIIKVKDDGTVNVSLIPRKQETMHEDSDVIYQFLIKRNGAMPYTDKSMAEDIQVRFKMSKSAFKRALGKLMKEGKIYQEEGWTYLKEEAGMKESK